VSKIIATCPICQTVRYRTEKDFERGGAKPVAADFKCENGQSEGSDTEQPKCSSCLVPLQFTADDAVKSALTRPKPPADSVQTLFAAQPGEEVREIKPLPEMKYLVVTNKRILVVDAGRIE
jgi:hypothetical protein